MWTKDRILAEIQRTAAGNGGKPLSERRFHEDMGLRRGEWRGRFWKRWSEAQIEAGFSPTEFRSDQRFSDDELIESHIVLMRTLGAFPTEVDWRMEKSNNPLFPGLDNVKRRLGRTRAERMTAVRAYAESRAGYEDIVALCDQNDITPTATDNGHDTPQLGYVYLLKSGKFYKIGYSNAVGRREYEVGLKVPEPVNEVHRIATDDPSGIEAYWHRRFAPQRKSGEWFDLSAADIAAFKRRKFM